MEIQKHITSGNFLQFALEHGQSKEKKSVWIHSYLLTMVMFQSKLFNCQGLVSLTYLFIYIYIYSADHPTRSACCWGWVAHAEGNSHGHVFVSTGEPRDGAQGCTPLGELSYMEDLKNSKELVHGFINQLMAGTKINCGILRWLQTSQWSAWMNPILAASFTPSKPPTWFIWN